MKALLLLPGLAMVVLTIDLNAQSARQLTRKIVPPPPAPTSPAAPAAKPATPVQPVAPVAPTSVPAPPPPADAEKAKQETVRKTVEFQKKRAEEGSAAAQYELGLRYLKGDGVPKDQDAGRQWIEKSATNGYSLAVKKLEELPTLKAKN